MTNLLTIHDSTTLPPASQDATPIGRQLHALFETIPEENLLRSLKTYYAGRRGYTYRVLWRTYVTMVVLNLPSFAALIRALHSNPYLAIACGILSYEAIPSKFAYSRFLRKLQVKRNEVLVKGIMRELTRRCYKSLPGFGKSVAIDSTDLKAWSNGTKERKTDPDAGWAVKDGTNGKQKFVWGYKLHLLVDTTHEIPMGANITKGNYADIRQATALMSQVQRTCGVFRPKYVICDAGYNSGRLRKVLKRQWRARPIIKARRGEKSIADETPEWKLLFNRRVAVERVFSRMKGHRRLNNIPVRRKRKVTVHSLIPVIVTQAMALAFPEAPRSCVSV